jgi:hypothetical protein
VLVLAVGLTVRVGIAAPRASIAELRAIACCAAHCPDTPRPPMRPHRCCFVDAGATDPASTATAPSLERPAATAMMLSAAIVPIAPHGSALVSIPRVALRAGPPSYLDTLRLRC